MQGLEAVLLAVLLTGNSSIDIKDASNRTIYNIKCNAPQSCQVYQSNHMVYRTRQSGRDIEVLDRSNRVIYKIDLN